MMSGNSHSRHQHSLLFTHNGTHAHRAYNAATAELAAFNLIVGLIPSMSPARELGTRECPRSANRRSPQSHIDAQTYEITPQCSTVTTNTDDHGLYGTLYKPLAKSMGEGKCRHPVAPKPLNGFRRSLEYITTSRM